MKMSLKLWAAGAVMLAASAPSYANVFELKYIGTGESGLFNAVIDLDVAASGDVATLISGTRNGVAIAALDPYASADNTLSFTNPYVTFGGLSYRVASGEAYNFYGNLGSYFETNSVIDPNGDSGADPISFASVNGVVISNVPEPTTWAVLVGGFAFIGLSLRRLRRRSKDMAFDEGGLVTA